MTTPQRHGIQVEADTLTDALDHTRDLRHALDTVLAKLPPAMATDAISAALDDLDKRIDQATRTDIRRGLLYYNHLIITPLDPKNPPGPQDMEKLAAAMRTLDDLGLLINPY